MTRVLQVYVVLSAALNVLFWIIFIQALLSWIPGLVTSSSWLGALDRAVSRVTEPLLQPIRDRLPGGAVIDFSPLVLLLLIQVARWLLGRLLLG